jgi:hypothetical protein
MPTPIIDLGRVTPTMLVDEIDSAATRAFEMAGDPSNALDDNPRIAELWMAVGLELRETARRLEARYQEVIDSPINYFDPHETPGGRGD